MRLRYLRVGGIPALPDLAVRFHEEPVFRRPYGMHFVVGVNGSGKTRLLAALVEVFLSLEQGVLPPFPVILAYELGRREEGLFGVQGERLCWLHHQGEESAARLGVFDCKALHEAGVNLERFDWDRGPDELAAGPAGQKAMRRLGSFAALGSGERDDVLPMAVLVYTSGALELWEDVFAGFSGETSLVDPELALSGERPLGWDAARERALARADAPPETGPVPAPAAEETPSLSFEGGSRTPSRAVLLSSPLVPLAAWAAVLEEAWLGPEHGERQTRTRGFAAAMERVGWKRAVTMGLRLDLADEIVERLGPGEQMLLKRLQQIATFARRDPDPSAARLLAFDLRQPVAPEPRDPAVAGQAIAAETTAEALTRAFGLEAPKPYDAFRVLHQWVRAGVLTGVTFALEKSGIEGLVTYDDLSDGERMFVGRMALLHLLRGVEGALVILDEPETHFNDAWKREIVDVIDGVMRDQTGEVVISTHSSLALTDAFDSEIVLLQRAAGDGRAHVVRTPIPTFGGSPSEIMRHVFGAPSATGQRAAEYLDVLLLAASHPDLTQVAWDERAEPGAREEAISALAELTKTLPHPYGGDAERRTFLRYLLRSLYRYAGEQLQTDVPALTAALEVVQSRLGSGYYEFELIRRVSALAE